MSTTNIPAGDLAARSLVITRIFDAPRALVFKAWTEPEHLARWWGPRGYSLPACKMESRPGADYFFRMQSPEGEVRVWHGTVREVVAPERIVWTCAIEDEDGTPFSAETILTVTFEEYGDKTRLTLNQAVFQSVAVRDAHESGWGGAFERLATHLASSG